MIYFEKMNITFCENPIIHLPVFSRTHGLLGNLADEEGCRRGAECETDPSGTACGHWELSQPQLKTKTEYFDIIHYDEYSNICI